MGGVRSAAFARVEQGTGLLGFAFSHGDSRPPATPPTPSTLKSPEVT